MMKKFYKFSRFILSLSLIFIVGCGDDPDPGLFPTYVSEDKPAPVINSIDSDKEALAGITIITLNGQNFSANPDENQVYFNGVRGETISSTTTTIHVKVPQVVGDSVQVKVSSFKVENFSNVFIYKILAGVEEYYPFDSNNGELPWAITFDLEGNMLVSIQLLGIKIVTADSLILKDFIPKGAETKWDALRIFSNGDVYGSKTSRGIWKMQESVTPTNAPWVVTPSGTFLKDFDFDQNTNLWAVGSNSFIFKIKQDLSVTQYPFIAQLKAVRVFQNDLYVAGLKSGIEGIWKIPIDANGDLGTEELYFNMTDNYPNVKTNAITFSQDGDLFFGTNKNPDPMIIVKAGGGSSELLYPGVIKASEILSMYWPDGNNLFITRAAYTDGATTYNQSVLRIDIQKPGAEYYNQ
ncbi:MAG: IPT/TIG domain-containing protein [Ignavibacteriaceae bacterium]|nr:IPT/TIG domain-containing protein [Ignavibacteriaceae bacterium]